MPKNLQNVREHILGVTRGMMAESGQTELNIRNIAAKCGIGTGTLYNYFSSKQEVLAAIIMQEWELTLRRMDRNTKVNTDCFERLRCIFEELSNFVQSIHSIWIGDGLKEFDNFDMHHIHEKKRSTRNQLNQKILDVLHNHVAPENEAVFADLLARVFLSYSAETGFEFNTLESFIKKMLV